MNDFRNEIKGLPKEVIDLYKAFPNRTDFIPFEMQNGKINFLVSSDEGIRMASVFSVSYGSTGVFKNVARQELLEMAERYSYVFEEEMDMTDSDYETRIQSLTKNLSTSYEEYNILGGSHDDAPIIKLVNKTIMNAIRFEASDIHIEASDSDLIIKFRIDGKLKTVNSLKRELQETIIARIKIMADMDVAENRRPQDGRINIQFGTKVIDIRVSTIPTVNGEKVVLRLLHRSESALKLESLGMGMTQMNLLRRFLRFTSGIILVTGPTGSGKTTTLYASVYEIKDESLNIITIEDPIEYKIKDVSQVQLNYATGVTFAKAIRTFLRQDPDIILVGEVRDEETAQAAIQASLTGHLVISTLHTNDAPTAITRLIEMEIEPFLLTGSILLVVAQRLVRKICPMCKVKTTIDKNTRDEIASYISGDELVLEEYFKGSGCDKCYGTGYMGRIGIFEFLTVDDDIRKLIMTRTSSTEIKALAVKKGMDTMFKNGIKLINKGITTPEEVITATLQSA